MRMRVSSSGPKIAESPFISPHSCGNAVPSEQGDGMAAAPFCLFATFVRPFFPVRRKLGRILLGGGKNGAWMGAQICVTAFSCSWGFVYSALLRQ